ncbi:unnamed protein product [Trichobilharzia szidati]|nr:unnamed protein product [Trichobilharzia szidati]
MTERQINFSKCQLNKSSRIMTFSLLGIGVAVALSIASIIHFISAVGSFLKDNWWISIIFSVIGFICSVLMVTIPHRVKNPPVNFIMLFVMIISLSYSIALDFVDISFKWIILRWTLSVTVCLCFIFVGVIIKRDLTVFIFPLLIYLLSAILLASITISVLYILTNKYILYVSFCIFEFVTVIPCLMVAGQMLSSKRDVHFTDDDYTTAAMIYFLLILQAVTSTVGPFETDKTKSNETSLLSSLSLFETTD